MLDTGEVGEGPVVESSVELAVHKAAGRVEDFPGPAVSRDAAVAFATRAGGALETGENFSSKHESVAEILIEIRSRNLLSNRSSNAGSRKIRGV